jgi:hypothetical protein
MSMHRVLFWALAVATVGVYLVMVLWTLPTIASYAGGLAPFDMRPTGYGFDEAKAFLSALGTEGTAFYRDVQHRLDILFPGLVAATLYFAIAALLPARSAPMRLLLALALLPVAAFDWLENNAVAMMLAAGAKGVTPEMVAVASRWSVLKAIVSTVAYSALLVLLVRRGWLLFRQRRART